MTMIGLDWIELNKNNFGSCSIDMPHVVHFKLLDCFFDFVVGVSTNGALFNSNSHIHFSGFVVHTNIVNALIDLFILRDGSMVNVKIDRRFGYFDQTNSFVNVSTFHHIS